MDSKIKFFLIMAMTIGLTTTSYAAATGWYVGMQLGLSNTNNDPKTLLNPDGTTAPPPIDASNTGMGGRLFTGYNFNPYAAIEGGFTHYGASTYSVSTNILSNNPAIRTSSLDLEGKGMFTVPDIGIGVFAKAGLAVLSAGRSGSLSTENNYISPYDTTTNGGGESATSVRPLLGVGVSYDLSQNWVADLSYTMVSGGGGVKSADLLALGISYHWVALYCGQFLC